MKIAELKVGDIIEVGTMTYHKCIVLAIGRYSDTREIEPGTGNWKTHTVKVRGREYTTMFWYTHDQYATRDRVVFMELRDNGNTYAKAATAIRYKVTDDKSIHHIIHSDSGKAAAQAKEEAIDEALEAMMRSKMEVFALAAGIPGREVDRWVGNYYDPMDMFFRALQQKKDFIQQLFVLWLKYQQARGESVSGHDPATLLEQLSESVKEHKELLAARPEMLKKAAEAAGVQIGSDDWNAPLLLDGVKAA
jgi:hypothetical protein